MLLDPSDRSFLAHPSPRRFSLEDFDFESFRAHAAAGFSRVCPKFAAFAGPVAAHAACRPAHAAQPEAYLPLLKHAGVGTVVRLNDPGTYDPAVFRAAGLCHVDLGFPDGAAPPRAVVRAFLEAADSKAGAVGVHCAAGLGRTGTLVALWLMHTYGWGAREAVGWLRLARPGSVLGPQQLFLAAAEPLVLAGRARGARGAAWLDGPRADALFAAWEARGGAAAGGAEVAGAAARLAELDMTTQSLPSGGGTFRAARCRSASCAFPAAYVPRLHDEDEAAGG
jgi:protein-tyrosine phosphatase